MKWFYSGVRQTDRDEPSQVQRKMRFSTGPNGLQGTCAWRRSPQQLVVGAVPRYVYLNVCASIMTKEKPVDALKASTAIDRCGTSSSRS
jgi:hypothetical protein